MKCLKYLIIFFLIAVSLTVEASTRRILIISTFDLEHPWTKKLCTEVNLRYRSAPAGPIVDYLVLNSILDRNGNFEEKFNLHLPLMRRGDYDIVVALMDDAIELILKNIDTLPNDLPIIFCGDPGFLKELNGKYPNIVGFGRSTELRQSVDLGLALYPQTEEIAIISDNFLSGRILNEQAQQELANFKRCKVTFLYGAKYNTKQMLAQVERMPQNTLIIFAPWRNFTQDGYASLEQIGRELRQAAKRPFLVFTDVLLGHGALGGILSEGDLLGRELTKTIDRILNGENLSSIGYSPMPNRCVIDLNEFDAEKLDRTLLPPGTILLNQKPSFFQEFPRLFTGVTILALLFVSAVAIIIILIIRHRGQCREMREQNTQKERKIERIFAEHTAVLNVIDDGLIVTDSNEYISFANPEAARLIGIPATEMLGRPLADVLHLTNPQSREKIVSHVLGEISTPGKSQIADLIAVDNSRRCVRFHIEILRNNADVAIGTAVRFCDISHEYKQRASMDEISQLLENAAALANFSYAQINDDGTVLTNFTSQEHNWGYRNGRTLPPNEWLHPDDLPEFEHKWEVLRRRESDSARIEYRAIKDGSVRYFVMDLKRMPGVAHHGKTVYSCIIQDVTEIGKRRQELADRNVMFRSIIDLLPSPLAIKDPHDDYRLYIVNSTYAKLVGRNMEDIIGKTDFDLFSPEVADIFRKHDQEAVTENKINFQELFPGKNGNRIFLAYKALLSAPSNKLLLLTVSTDISEIEATKERALKSEQLLRAIIDNVPIGIYLKNPDEDYHYQLWNAQLAHDLGMSFSSAEGKSDFDLPFAPGRADYYRRQDEQIMRDQRSIVVEEDFFAPDGKKMIYRNTKMPVALHGNKRYILGCLENITEIRQITNCLKQTVDSQKNSLLREQIYNECLQFLSMEDNFETAVNQFLTAIGKHCGVDRCFIFCKRVSLPTIDHNFIWMRTGLSGDTSIWQNYDPADSPELWNNLNAQKIIRINDFNEYPDILQSMRNHAGDNFDQKALLLSGIFDEEGYWGLIGMSITVSDKKFTELDEEVLRNCIKLFLLARERERRKLELKHALLLQEMISSYSDIPILLFDAHGKLLNINQAGCEMFSLTRHEALDLPCCQTICRTPAPPPNCPMNTVLRTGKFAEFHWSRGGRDYHVSAKPIFDEQKKLLYVLESGIDITEANLTQRKLIAAMEAAKEGERAKSDFISTMNHELRTPLNAVIGFSELLQTREMSSAEQSESLQAIKNSGKALLNLLNDVLDISQLDAERFAFSPVKTDILALLLELASIFQISAEKKNLDFKLLMPDALPELYVDPARIRQAIVNVVGNALKFTRIGSVVLAVRFDFVASDSGNLQIEVEDTGIGIKNELLEKIFEPFWQDDQVRDSRAYQGSGLGLAITQKLVNAMNGEISVVSCKNIGSTFTMTFNAVKFISPLPPETTQERVG